jgi:hypothetical protein
MTTNKPHFLLFCDGNASSATETGNTNRGRWKFVLENVENGQRIEATDVEPAAAADRCALVSVLRGLEALEQPSRVTLVTTSRYVTRGLQYGLTEWRDNDFSWEHFGAVQPIRNADIWRRIDRTLAFHQVQCRWMSQEEGAEAKSHASETNAAILANKSGDASPSRHSAIARAIVPTAAIAIVGNDGRDDGPIMRPATLGVRSRSVSTSAVAENRTELPSIDSIKHQRIFVDTPFHVRALSESKPTDVIAPFEPESRICQGEHPKALQPLWMRIAFAPFRFTLRTFHLGWQWILAIDDWLESFLRCMLLMDPRKQRTHLKNSSR